MFGTLFLGMYTLNQRQCKVKEVGELGSKGASYGLSGPLCLRNTWEE